MRLLASAVRVRPRARSQATLPPQRRGTGSAEAATGSGPFRPRHRSGIAARPHRGRIATPTATTLLALLAATPPLVAQQGTVTYEHVVKRELPPGVAQRMREPPPPQTSTVIVHFSPTNSLMIRQANRNRGREGGGGLRGGGDRAARAARAAAASDFRPGRFPGRFGFGGGADPDAATVLEAAYLDYGEATMVEARRFLGRAFRVTRERPSYAWRIATEQAEHLGYTVMKATAEHDSTTVEAWFTPQIPIPGGPASFGGLPGMILVLSLNDGQTQYQATEVALKELEAGLIVPPEDGDQVSYEEFEKLVKERIEEMMRSRRRPGSDGGPWGNEQ